MQTPALERSRNMPTVCAVHGDGNLEIHIGGCRQLKKSDIQLICGRGSATEELCDLGKQDFLAAQSLWKLLAVLQTRHDGQATTDLLDLIAEGRHHRVVSQPYMSGIETAMLVE